MKIDDGANHYVGYVGTFMTSMKAFLYFPQEICSFRRCPVREWSVPLIMLKLS